MTSALRDSNFSAHYQEDDWEKFSPCFSFASNNSLRLTQNVTDFVVDLDPDSEKSEDESDTTPKISNDTSLKRIRLNFSDVHPQCDKSTQVYNKCRFNVYFWFHKIYFEYRPKLYLLTSRKVLLRRIKGMHSLWKQQWKKRDKLKKNYSSYDFLRNVNDFSMWTYILLLMMLLLLKGEEWYWQVLVCGIA